MPKINSLKTDKYSVKIVKNLSEFLELKNLWDIFSTSQGSDLPFVNFDWYKLWIKHFLKNDKLYIAILYKNSVPLIIAPLQLIEEKFFFMKIKKLIFIGNAYSPVRKFIFRYQNDNEENLVYLSFLMRHLFKNSENWNIIELFPITVDEIYLKIISMIHSNKWKFTNKNEDSNWYLDNINYSGDAYLKKRSKKLRLELKRREKRLKELGTVNIKIIKSEKDLDKYLNIYYELYSKSWKKKEKIGPTFHRDFAKLAAKNDWLRLSFLFLDDIAIASQLRIVNRSTCFFLKTVYDPSYKKYSPGKLLLSHMIKYFIDEDKIKAIDFGPGNESYKSSWASEKRELRKIIIFNDSVEGKILAFIKIKLSPLIKKGKVKKLLKKNISKFCV